MNCPNCKSDRVVIGNLWWNYDVKKCLGCGLKW